MAARLIDIPLGVVLACDTCQFTYEPDADDFRSGRTGCPECGGWTWIAELVEPGELPSQRAATTPKETPRP